MKAVLLINMPNQCIECPCYRQSQCEEIYEWCNVTDRRLTWKEVAEVPEWCPLKPMPNKLDANEWHRMFGGTYKEREAKGYGWNACLEEIEK